MDKYRVWHTGWEEFVTDYPICMNVLTGKIVKFEYGEYSDEEDIEDTKYILSKYTGLKDKNGVEIYEGDIVEAVRKHSEPKLIEDRYCKGIITYSHGCYDIKVEPNVFSGLIPENLLTDIDLTIEVIGNIYENENLLK